MPTKKTRLLDKLPSHFDIGWAKFEFKLKKNLYSEESKCYGVTDFNEFTITLEQSMENITAHPTIIHECCHVLMESLGLGGPEEDKSDSVVSNNEFITEASCRAFLLFKNLNPELWNTLFEEYYE